MNLGRVLVVDDEPDLLDNCRRLLTHADYEARTLQDPSGLQAAMAEAPPDVLLLDLRMPQMDGMTVLAAALATDPSLAVIIMTAYGSVASAVRLIREGAFDYLTKPFSGDQLTLAVSRALRYRGLSVENRALRAQAAQDGLTAKVVGGSTALAIMLSHVRRVAPSDASVLILGESGTGKELVARCIHELSLRKGGPFVPIDCAAMPENLLESELFGHERGAFTGAVARKRGLLVEANGGTVFLDEIGELGPALQAKLLRALEEREVRSVGGREQIPINIRLLAATNLDLEEAVRAGRFRADLFFRLNVVPIQIPPLRVRLGDVPELLSRFLHEFALLSLRERPRVSPEALAALEAYHWPGNVRELRNLAQRLVVLDEDGRITLSDLPEAIRGWPATSGGPPGPPQPYEEAREAAMLEFVRQYLRRLLDYHGGNVSRAADAAGVSRRTVHRWLAELGTARMEKK